MARPIKIIALLTFMAVFGGCAHRHSPVPDLDSAAITNEDIRSSTLENIQKAEIHETQRALSTYKNSPNQLTLVLVDVRFAGMLSAITGCQFDLWDKKIKEMLGYIAGACDSIGPCPPATISHLKEMYHRVGNMLRDIDSLRNKMLQISSKNKVGACALNIVESQPYVDDARNAYQLTAPAAKRLGLITE